MNATIYDVSRLSGVSTATVSRAFSNPEQVREAKKQGLIDQFIYGSISATYLAALMDTL